MIKFFMEDVDTVKIGEKSTHGRGGMGAKIDAALSSVKPGSKCNACIVVGGHDLDAIRGTVGKLVLPVPKGTLFATPGTQLFEIAATEVETLVVSIDIIVTVLTFLFP
jgi:delta-1-pyrroline-5-carboxylate synthetase